MQCACHRPVPKPKMQKVEQTFLVGVLSHKPTLNTLVSVNFNWVRESLLRESLTLKPVMNARNVGK